MPSSLIRKIIRGWDRKESFWDTVGMDENLRTLGDHLPLDIKYVTGPRPATASEGECWIEPSTGVYAVWSTGPKLQAPSWHIYPPLRALFAVQVDAGVMWVNTGTAWESYGLAILNAELC